MGHMRTSRLLAVALVATAALVMAPSAGASQVAKAESTIMVPLLDVGTWFGAGYGNWTQTGDDMAVARQTCPEPGDYDGYTWRFFDLKGEYTKFVAQGPKPAAGQVTPLGTFHDYDIDLWLLDAKCNRIDVPNSNAGGGYEKQSTRKPARYAVIVYWYGHQVNLPVTLEYSK